MEFKELKNSTCSDDSGSLSSDRKEQMNTKASSHDDLESKVEYGKTELPPLYVDI